MDSRVHFEWAHLGLEGGAARHAVRIALQQSVLQPAPQIKTTVCFFFKIPLGGSGTWCRPSTKHGFIQCRVKRCESETQLPQNISRPRLKITPMRSFARKHNRRIPGIPWLGTLGAASEVLAQRKPGSPGTDLCSLPRRPANSPSGAPCCAHAKSRAHSPGPLPAKLCRSKAAHASPSGPRPRSVAPPSAASAAAQACRRERVSVPENPVLKRAPLCTTHPCGEVEHACLSAARTLRRSSKHCEIGKNQGHEGRLARGPRWSASPAQDIAPPPCLSTP